jgi:hypothetical protein
MPTQPTVCIVESLNFLEEQTHREGEIISRTLQLSRKPTAYVYIRTVDELRAVAEEFGASDHRYLHLSFHGLVDKKKMVGLALSVGEISNEDLVDLLGPHLAGRRLFLSSCLAARSDLATTLLERSDCRSVLAPMSSIRFDDAAVFWTAFYHLMFKGQPNSMSNTRIEEKVRICASLVNERFSLFYAEQKKSGKKVTQLTIGPLKKPK